MIQSRAGAAGVLLLLATVAAFADTLVNGFVWIDHWQIESGGLIASSWPQLWQQLTAPLGAMPGWQGAAPYARPSVVLFLSLVHALGGGQAGPYHAALLLLHVGNVGLAFLLLRRLGCDLRVATAVTGLFALHPLQTAAVSWISGIADPLFTFWMLAAFLLIWPTLLHPGGGARLAGGAVCFAVALGAKETAALLPLLLLAAAVLLPLEPPSSPRRVLIALTVLGGVLAVDGIYRAAILHSAAMGGSFGGIPLAVRLRTLPRLLAGYLTLPLRLNALTVCDDAALSESWDAATLAGLALLIAVLGAAVALRRRVPAATFGIVWMLLLLLPVLNVVPILHYRADRFFYLPLLGWSIAVVAVAGTLPTPAVLRSPAVGWSGIVAALLALATLTALRNRVFSDDVALFEATLRVSPLCREAHTTLGDAYLHQGRADAAARQYEAALAPAPGRISYVVTPKVHINLGMAYLAQHRYADAEQHFAAAHREQPGLLHPLFGLGVATLAQGRPAEAADWLQRAAALAPGDPDVAFNLALAYDRLGRAADAATAYARFIAVAPPGHARTVAEQRLRVLRPNS